MSSTTHKTGRVIDIDDTVGFLPQTQPAAEPNPALAATTRLVPPPRRPDATGEQRIVVPHTIGVVDEPLHTGALPIVVQAALHQARPAYSGRHRTGMLARLRRLIGGAR